MKRRVTPVLLGFAIAMVLAYSADSVVLHLRIAHGTGYGTIQVQQFLATPLKGEKAEYDAMGEAPVTCAHSLFPQPGLPACWWLARHRTEWQ